jgi:hypothetical protein
LIDPLTEFTGPRLLVETGHLRLELLAEDFPAAGWTGGRGGLRRTATSAHTGQFIKTWVVGGVGNCSMACVSADGASAIQPIDMDLHAGSAVLGHPGHGTAFG